MTFDWKEYLNLAQILKQNGKKFNIEASLRCATSRAYYASFCYSRNYARDKQSFIPTNRAEDHRLVREHFRSKNKIVIATKLDQLRQWRNDCDYQDKVNNLHLICTSAIKESQIIINNLV